MTATATRLVATAVAALFAGACASTRYAPQVVAPQELTLRFEGGLEMVSGGAPVASSPRWSELPAFVRCVPEAAAHAQQAHADGTAATVLSIIGGALGVAALGSLAGLSSDDGGTQLAWLGAGAATAAVGLVVAIIGRSYRFSADGHAVDAMNFYNDAAGSLGTGCGPTPLPAPMPQQPPPGEPMPPGPPPTQ